MLVSVGYTVVDLQNVVGIIDHFSLFFKTNGTKANTCDGITTHCIMWVLIIMMWHILRWQGNRADGLQDVEDSCENIK
jgi:hypothetical protein